MMKKILLCLAVTALLAGCNKDGENEVPDVTENLIAGKWNIYEYIIDGKAETAALSDRLSYLEFDLDGVFYDYSYYYNQITQGTYTVQGNSMTINELGRALAVEITRFNHNNTTFKISGEYLGLKRSENRPLFYLEPSVKFGSTKKDIKEEELRSLNLEKPESLKYTHSNANEDALIYLFEDNRMIAAGVVISTGADMNKLAAFLTEKYGYVGKVDDYFLYQGPGYEVTVSFDNIILVLYSNILTQGVTTSEILDARAANLLLKLKQHMAR